MLTVVSSVSPGIDPCFGQNGRTNNAAFIPGSRQDPPALSGYNVRLTTSGIAEHLQCQLCKKLLRNPWQLSCGHRVCASCLSHLQRSSESAEPRCPVDGSTIKKEETFRDVFAEREVMSLVVCCSSRGNSDDAAHIGCSWRGEMRALKDHEEVCDFMPQVCPNNCGEEILRKNMAEHLARKCKARPLPCQHCQQEVAGDKMAKHMSSCPKAPVTCPNGCSARVAAREQLAEHLQVCPKQVVKCFYHPMGCDFEGPRSDLLSHHDSSMAFHLQLCFMHAQNTQIAMDKLSQENRMLTEKLSSLESDFKHLQELVKSNLASAQQHLPDRKPLPQHGKDNKYSGSEIPADGGSSANQQAGMSLEQLAEVQEQRLVAVERSVALHDLQLSEMDIRQNLQDTKMSNGVLVWKISNFKRRQQDAISGKTSSLYSPPFYTSPAGYKVCARLYPNGDGVGRGTHLSFFFVVMKGDFDALLPWPFQQKVSLILMDQNRINPRDVIETFRPDAKSSSFQRPKNDMNVASGCPLFVPLSTLNNSSYLCEDDTVYLKVIIHPHGLQAPDKS